MTLMRSERERRGWSRAELARRTGMAAGCVGLIEAGRFVPYPGQREKLSQALGVPAERLLDPAEPARQAVAR